MSEAAVEAAQALVTRLEGEIRQAGTELAGLAEGKRRPALEASKGNREAAKRLHDLNVKIRELELSRDDLESALAGARVELAEAELAERRRLDLLQADRIEVLAQEFTEASGATDAALARLVEEFRKRAAIGRKLQELLPRSDRAEFSHRWASTWWAASAALAAGLGDFMQLGFVERHHQKLLTEQAGGHPEIKAAVAQLRGEVSQSNAEAA